jgi:hypothetical protein
MLAKKPVPLLRELTVPLELDHLHAVRSRDLAGAIGGAGVDDGNTLEPPEPVQTRSKSAFFVSNRYHDRHVWDLAQAPRRRSGLLDHHP